MQETQQQQQQRKRQRDKKKTSSNSTNDNSNSNSTNNSNSSKNSKTSNNSQSSTKKPAESIDSSSKQPITTIKKTLKLVIRKLPPDLTYEDYVGTLQEDETLSELVNKGKDTDNELDKFILDSYYITGHYSKKPFKSPIYSRCYYLINLDNKENESINLKKFVSILQDLEFKNSKTIKEIKKDEGDVEGEAEGHGDELSELEMERLQEIFKPVVEKALYYKMNYPHKQAKRADKINKIK
ncbi:unnamed protein product [[Candida] boidinii]|uniref:Unnamed protein product n=1 Tax=Candida boidinii TaxID=5477 RepID=A0A9W6T790_CANBO|nr:unnamed protein product [[Candida] boidinii]